MFSLRSKSEPARIASAITLVLSALALLVAIPATALAAPEGGEEPPLPQLAFEPSSYDFGLVQLNGNTNQATLQLRNVGSAATAVYSFDVSGGNGAFWTGPTDCIRTLNPGEICSIQVYFGPYSPSPFAAQLRAHGEAGTAFTADLSGEGGRPIFAPAIDPTNFGSVPVGSGGLTRTIEVSNVGNMPGGVFIAVISGGAVGSFHLLDENCTGVLLTPAATCNLQVSFRPISTGVKTARLSLFGEGDGGTQIILSGIGLDPEPAADESRPGAAVATVAKPSRRHRPRRGHGGRRRYRSNVNYRRAIG